MDESKTDETRTALSDHEMEALSEILAVMGMTYMMSVGRLNQQAIGDFRPHIVMEVALAHLLSRLASSLEDNGILFDEFWDTLRTNVLQVMANELSDNVKN